MYRLLQVKGGQDAHPIKSKTLVQRGRNNPPVKKGSKAYCKSNIPSALEPPYFCLLALVQQGESFPPGEKIFLAGRFLLTDELFLQKHH